MVDDQTIQDLCNRIVQDFQPERIILFGSSADGNPTERHYRAGDPDSMKRPNMV
jgi:hypothetical protein